ncbi:unnamed protein product [Penicillium manginii]
MSLFMAVVDMKTKVNQEFPHLTISERVDVDRSCAFNHDPQKVNSAYQSDINKKRFNVDSPSFTPSILSGNGVSGPKKSNPISPKAANAAPFQPRTAASRMASPVPAPKTPLTGKGSNTSTPRQEVGTPDWSMAEVQEFVPQGFEGAHMSFPNHSWLLSADQKTRGALDA